MRKTFWHRAVYWALLLAFGFMLTGKAVACPFPSAMEMSQGNAMDCCADYCRMETTHEAAEKACDQSRLAFSPNDTLSSPDKTCEHSAAAVLSDFSPLPLFFSSLLEPESRIKRVRNEPPFFRHASTVPIYTTIQTFLI